MFGSWGEVPTMATRKLGLQTFRSRSQGAAENNWGTMRSHCSAGFWPVGFEIPLGECKSCDWLIALLNRFLVAVRWLDGIKH